MSVGSVEIQIQRKLVSFQIVSFKFNIYHTTGTETKHNWIAYHKCKLSPSTSIKVTKAFTIRAGKNLRFWSLVIKDDFQFNSIILGRIYYLS